MARTVVLMICASISLAGAAMGEERAVDTEQQETAELYEIEGMLLDTAPDTSDENFARLAAAESNEDAEAAFRNILGPRPVPGVGVMLLGESITGEETVTDPNGRFMFGGLERGRYVLLVERIVKSPETGEERVDVAREEVQLDGNRKVKLAFGPSRITVKGRIADPNGQPVAGAKVIGIQEIDDPGNMHWPNVVRTVSGADGAYELSGLNPPDTYRTAGFLNGGDPTLDLHSFYLVVRVEAEGFVQERENVPRFPLVTEEILDAARKMRKGLMLYERIVSPDGPHNIKEEEAGADTLPFSQGNIIPNIDIVLNKKAKRAYVRGRVMNTEGKPEPDRVLSLWPVRSGPPVPGSEYVANDKPDDVTTDKDGYFVIENAAPGRYSILAARPHLNDNYSMHQEPVRGRFLNMNAGARINDFEVVVYPPKDFAISGHVKDAKGNPLRKVYVSTFIPHGSHWWDYTDDEGYFCLEGLDGIGISFFRVNFRSGGFNLTVPDVPLNTKDVELVIPDNGSIRGVVCDAKIGKAVTNYEVTVPLVTLPDSGAIYENRGVQVEQKPDGSFEISDVPAGEATVEIKAEGLGVQRFVTLVEAGNSVPAEYKMSGAAVLEGRTSADGKPRQTNVIINGQWLHTEADGRFRFEQFPNGNYAIWFYATEAWYRHAEVQLKSGEVTRLDMDMGGTGEVFGSVIFDEEQGPCMVQLAARPAPDGWADGGRPDPQDRVLSYSFVGESGGKYSLTHIPAGRWHLMVGSHHNFMHRYVLTMSKMVDVKEGQKLQMDLNLTEEDY